MTACIWVVIEKGRIEEGPYVITRCETCNAERAEVNGRPRPQACQLERKQ